MMLKVKGQNPLAGQVTISGSKNAALPILAAALLTKKAVLTNVPQIGDVQSFLSIVSSIGAKVTFEGNTVTIVKQDLNIADIDRSLIKKIRAGVLLLWPLLTHCESINIPHPGGCNIGKRPLDDHLKGFRSLGYNVEVEADDTITFSGCMREGHAEISAGFAVTATENLLIASVLRKGTTRITMAAIEPHVSHLVRFLQKIGANITMHFDHTIEVTGVEKLADEVEFEIISDYIEAGTFFVLGALAADTYIDIINPCRNDLTSFYQKAKEAGVRFEFIGDMLRVYRSTNLRAVNIQTNIFPGFPTDLQSPFAILLTQADGISRIHEIMFEGRLNYLVEIEKMKGHPAILNPHEALIFGKTPLRGATVSSWDLRAGVAMIIAGLIASEETFITNVEYIDRGYERVVEKLQKLGASIERICAS